MDNPKYKIITDKELLGEELKNPLRIQVVEKYALVFPDLEIFVVTYNLMVSKKIFIPIFQIGSLTFILN